MKWLKRLFTIPPEKNGKPTHAELANKTDDILAGVDKTSKQVEKLKTGYSKDLLRLQKQVKIIKRSAEALSNEIDTAVAIAIASQGES